MDFNELQTKTINKLGLEKCILVWDEEVVKNITQSTDKIDFFTALQKAIHSFLTDGTSMDSFVATLKDMPENFGLSNAPDINEIQKVIQDNLNSAQTKITLVTPKTQFQPEEGESPLENWIFLVEDTQMSPGMNWAIVNRQSGKVYNYGIT